MKIPWITTQVERPQAPSPKEALAPSKKPLDPTTLKGKDKRVLETLIKQLEDSIDLAEDPAQKRIHRASIWNVEAALGIPEKNRKGMNPGELRNLEVVAEARAALSPAGPVRTGWPWWLKLWHLWLVLLILGFLASAGATPGTYVVIIVPYSVALWVAHKRRQAPTPSERSQPTNAGAQATGAPPATTTTPPVRSYGLSGCVVLIIKVVGGFFLVLFILAALSAGVSQENLCGGLILPAMILIPLIVWRYLSIPVIPIESDRSPIVLPKATPLNLGWPPVHNLSRGRKVGRFTYLITSLIIYYPDEHKIVHYWGLGNFIPWLGTDYDTLILKTEGLAVDGDGIVLLGQLRLDCELEGGQTGTVWISCRRQGTKKKISHGLWAQSHRIVERIYNDVGG